MGRTLMAVSRWIRTLTEEIVGGSPVEVGVTYVHPEDGPIEIVSGQYWGEFGMSNHWYWVVLATGEKKSGYGAHWPRYGAPIK